MQNENGNGNGSRGSFHLQFGRWAMDIAAGNLLTILTVLGLLGLVGGAGYFQLSFVSAAKADHIIIRQEHIDMRQQLDEKMEVIIYLLSRPEHERPTLAIPYGIERRLAIPKFKEQ